MKSNKNTIETSNKNQLSSKILDITQRLDILQLNYIKETNQLKEELAVLQCEVDNLSETGYHTADEDSNETPTIPVAIPAQLVNVISRSKRRSRSIPDPLPLPPYPKYKRAQALTVGDIVQITNGYKGKYGTVGKIVRLESYWVWLRYRDNEQHQRARFNIRLAQDPIQYGYIKERGEFCWPGWE